MPHCAPCVTTPFGTSVMNRPNRGTGTDAGGREQARGQDVVAVARHSGYGKQQLAAAPDERQQVLAEVERGAAEVVV